MESYAVFAKNVHDRRISMKMTQAQLAHAIGISPKTLSNLEHGIVGKRFGATQVFRLADVLRCTPDALFK